MGLTTEEEFDKHINQHNAAFSRRFVKVPIGNTTEEERAKYYAERTSD